MTVSQKQILANYQQIFNSFAQNHIALSKDSQGLHNSLTFRAQIGDPVTAVDQSALYNKIVSSVPQLFFRPSSNQTPIQMTNSNLNTSVGSTESTYLAGPFTVYIGYRLSIANNTTITLLPATTLIYAGISIINSLKISQAAAINLAANTFVVKFIPNTAANADIYYLAIGM